MKTRAAAPRHTLPAGAPSDGDSLSRRSRADIDGAYFGTTFPHLFLMQFPELIPTRPAQSYVPRVFGFRINRESVYHTANNSNSASGRARGSHSARARSAPMIHAHSSFSPAPAGQLVKRKSQTKKRTERKQPPPTPRAGTPG